MWGSRVAMAILPLSMFSSRFSTSMRGGGTTKLGPPPMVTVLRPSGVLPTSVPTALPWAFNSSIRPGGM